MPEFDSIVYKWYNGLGTWIDITTDVQAGVRGSCGILSTDINSRTGGIGTLNLTLDNSELNSAGLLGYYTPRHPNCIGINWGKPYYYPIKIIFTYQGRQKVLRYTFEPGPNGISVTPGQYGSRKVTASFRNWMGFAQERKLNLLPSYSEKRADEAIELILAELDADEQPQAKSINTGNSTFEAVFDDTNSGTTVMGELSKLALSELGYIYVRADRNEGETLVFENRNLRYQTGGLILTTSSSLDDGGALMLETGDYLLLEDGDNLLLDAAFSTVSAVSVSDEDCGLLLLETGDYLLLEDGDNLILNETVSADFTDVDIQVNRNFDVRYFDNPYHSVRVSVQQKETGDSTVTLWSMEKPLYIANGQTITGIHGRYRDPSGGSSYINGVYDSTDHAAFANENGTGTDYSGNITVTADAGSAEVKHQLHNSGPACYVIQLDAIGFPIYSYDSLDIVNGDDTGKKRLDVNLHYETDAAVAQRFSDVLTRNPNGTRTIQRLPLFANKNNFNMNAFMDLDVGSLINVSEEVTYPDLDNPFFINGYEFEIIGVNNVFWYPNGFPYSRVYIPEE